MRYDLIRNRLVVVERGWVDFEVDPLRYRLSVHPGAARFLGRFLRKPDLVVHMTTPGEVALSRKAEISFDEYERQQSVLQSVASRSRHLVTNASGGTLENVRAEVADDVKKYLESRARARLTSGWIRLAGGRLHLPREPRRATNAALDLFQPVTLKGRCGVAVAKAAGHLGVLRLMPRVDQLPEEVEVVLERAGFPSRHSALLTSNHPGRYSAKLLDEAGRSHGIAKIATDLDGREALAAEAAALRAFGPLLEQPLRAPSVLGEGPGVLVVEDVKWKLRRKPWLLPSEIAASLGSLYAASADGHSGVIHGDFAPWNLLETDRGWVLIDWESARLAAAPFFDVFHYMTQAHALLSAISAVDVISSLDGRGPYASAIGAFAVRAGEPMDRLVSQYRDYLELSRADLDPARPDEEHGIRTRTDLLHRLSRRGRN